MSIVIVTATGTGVGKTVVSAALAATALAAGRSVAVVKPAQTGVLPGEPGDLAEIAGLAGADCSLHELARYPDPLAPASAARLAGAPALTAAEVADYVRGLEHDLVIVEGAGGALVHLNDEGETLLDVTQLLHAAGAAVELVLVTRAGLGALHDAGAASLAIRTATGADADHLVVGSWPESPDLAERTNLADFARYTPVPLSGLVPAGSGALDAAAFATVALASLSPALGGTLTDPTSYSLEKTLIRKGSS